MGDKEASAYLQLFASALPIMVMFHPSYTALTCYTLRETSSPMELFTPDRHASTHTQRYLGKKGTLCNYERVSITVGFT